MEYVHQLVGRNVKGKVCRNGFPIGIGKVTSVRDANMGNIRVTLEDGTSALMIYPVEEVLN